MVPSEQEFGSGIRIPLTLSILAIFFLLSSSGAQSEGMISDERIGQQAAAPGDQTIYLPLIVDNWLFDSIFGIWSGSFQGTALTSMVEAHAIWNQGLGVPWADVEPTEGARNWSALASLEQKLITARQNHISPVVVVNSTPVWAQLYPGVSCGPIMQTKLDKFAAFMGDLVARYSPWPYEVEYWEIWNEPDIDRDLVFPDSPWGCWGDDTDTSYYGGEYFGQMLMEIYPAIKAADADANVLVGGLLLDCDPNNPPSGKDCTPSYFLRGILQQGAGSSFDGVSFHANDFYHGFLGGYGNNNWASFWNVTGPTINAKADFIRSELSSYGFPNKFLINSENNIMCHPDSGFVCESAFETTKAYYVAEAYATAIGQQLTANMWYSLYGWIERKTGLLDSSGDPLPAYQTFTFAARVLQDCSFSNLLSVDPNVLGVECDRGDRVVWVMWSKDGNSHNIALPSTPAAAYEIGTDGFENSLSVGSSVNVGIPPVFLEFFP